MMYQTIYKALLEVGLDGQLEPQDFLNFFCLGNREVGTREVPDGTVNVYNCPRKPPQPNAAQVYIYKCLLLKSLVSA
jgi:phospholipase D1/2